MVKHQPCEKADLPCLLWKFPVCPALGATGLASFRRSKIQQDCCSSNHQATCQSFYPGSHVRRSNDHESRRPRGSGVAQVLGAGEFLQSTVDSDSKHFDLVSFDPRGVLNSGSDANCFSNPLQRDLWNLKSHEEGHLDSGNRALGLQWAKAKALGTMCATAEIGKYMGTASVVRDVLEIVDRIEEHYQKSRLEMESRLDPTSTEAQSQLLNMEHANVGVPMLQYLGFSYGTFLGNTFASMFPDRVKRMVLDGVVDATDYTAQGWTTNLQDTDKVMQAFYKYCFDAAYRCPLYDRAGPEAIERRMIGFLKHVQQNPVVAVDDSGSLPPNIITYSDIR
jgi:alpha/beta hydrolase fold